MAGATHIEWTDCSWNPIVGCAVKSPGCTNCYAMLMAGTRLAHMPLYAGLTKPSKAGPVWTGIYRLNEAALEQPLHWRKPRKIFVNSMSDLFGEGVTDEMIDRVFDVMRRTPHLTYQVLTKRSDRMREYITKRYRLPDHIAEFYREEGGPLPVCYQPLPNVWLGVSAEDQTRFDERIADLMATPAAVRFISFEPLLGRINAWAALNSGLIHWAIVGGESGPKARPMHPDWVRCLRDQCAAAYVAFFFKQHGEFREWNEAPYDSPEPGEISADCSEAEAIAAAAIKPCFLTIDGYRANHVDDIPADVPARLLERVGKKAAGRVLDGRTHNDFPAALAA